MQDRAKAGENIHSWIWEKSIVRSCFRDAEKHQSLYFDALLNDAHQKPYSFFIGGGSMTRGD